MYLLVTTKIGQFIHVTKADRVEVGAAHNDKMQKWGLQFNAGQEASFFLKSSTKVRLARDETKRIKLRVCDARDGSSTLEEVEVAYADVRTYLQDFRGANIHYLTEIVEQTCEHDVNVWVCGEAVLYLPPPVMRLDPLHSATIAKTFGKRWEKEHRDTQKDPKSHPSSKMARPVTQIQDRSNKRAKR